MSMKYCQGPRCHTYDTKDRKKGPKDNKRNETRRRSSMYYGKGNFCSLNCYNDWAEVFSDRAIDHFGRIHEPIKLTADNAWIKHERYYNPDNEAPYYWYNRLTEQELPLTKEQYNNPDLVRP